jgi:hypothetical protein
MEKLYKKKDKLSKKIEKMVEKKMKEGKLSEESERKLKNLREDLRKISNRIFKMERPLKGESLKSIALEKRPEDMRYFICNLYEKHCEMIFEYIFEASNGKRLEMYMDFLKTYKVQEPDWEKILDKAFMEEKPEIARTIIKKRKEFVKPENSNGYMYYAGLSCNMELIEVARSVKPKEDSLTEKFYERGFAETCRKGDIDSSLYLMNFLMEKDSYMLGLDICCQEEQKDLFKILYQHLSLGMEKCNLGACWNCQRPIGEHYLN